MKMSVICLIDNTEHESIEALHKHIRPLMKQETYWTHYHPKVCLGSGKSIPFKNAEQYLNQDFIDKNQIEAFIKKDPVRAREWAIDWLRKRKEEKGLVYAPSQAELRSLSCPSMPYYESVGGYYKITRELGFKDRYTGQSPEFMSVISSVVQDSREQQPLKLGIPILVAALNHGDYRVAGAADKGVYIERKSISDFAGTLNSRENTRENKVKDDTVFTNIERFDRELARAQVEGHYVVMLVETSITDALSFKLLPQMRWSRVQPSHVWHNLRAMLTKYPLTFQAVFADGRQEAARIALKIFQMGEQVKKVDLQYVHEKGLL